MNYEIRTTCPECRGTGRNLDNANCGRCWGSGEATTTKKGTTVMRQRTHSHSIRRACNPFDNDGRDTGRYVISWHQPPVRQQVKDAIHMRTVGVAAARRFAKKWGVSMPD